MAVVDMICNVVGIIGTLITGFLSLFLFCRNIREKRLENLEMLWNKLRSRAALDVFYKIDYDEKWYSREFHDSEAEQAFDEYLTSLSFLCFLKTQRAIGCSELKSFEYELSRTLQNTQVIDYLYNVHHFSEANGRKSPFSNLKSYAEKEGFINAKVFNDPLAYKSHRELSHNLNW